MKKPNRRRPAPSAPLGTLAARAAEAMKQQRFKEAVDLFKLMIRHDPQAEWKQSETGREAKFYQLTAAGRAQLEQETASWARLTEVVGLFLQAEGESA